MHSLDQRKALAWAATLEFVETVDIALDVPAAAVSPLVEALSADEEARAVKHVRARLESDASALLQLILEGAARGRGREGALRARAASRADMKEARRRWNRVGHDTYCRDKSVVDAESRRRFRAFVFPSATSSFYILSSCLLVAWATSYLCTAAFYAFSGVPYALYYQFADYPTTNVKALAWGAVASLLTIGSMVFGRLAGRADLVRARTDTDGRPVPLRVAQELASPGSSRVPEPGVFNKIRWRDHVANAPTDRPLDTYLFVFVAPAVMAVFSALLGQGFVTLLLIPVLFVLHFVLLNVPAVYHAENPLAVLCVLILLSVFVGVAITRTVDERYALERGRCASGLYALEPDRAAHEESKPRRCVVRRTSDHVFSYDKEADRFEVHPVDTVRIDPGDQPMSS